MIKISLGVYIALLIPASFNKSNLAHISCVPKRLALYDSLIISSKSLHR